MELYNIIFTLLNGIILYPIIYRDKIEKQLKDTKAIIQSEYLIILSELVDKISDDSILISKNRDEILNKFIRHSITSNKDLNEADRFNKQFLFALKYSVISIIAYVILFFAYVLCNKFFGELPFFKDNTNVMIIILSFAIINVILISRLIFKETSFKKIYGYYEKKF